MLDKGLGTCTDVEGELAALVDKFIDSENDLLTVPYDDDGDDHDDYGGHDRSDDSIEEHVDVE